MANKQIVKFRKLSIQHIVFAVLIVADEAETALLCTAVYAVCGAQQVRQSTESEQIRLRQKIGGSAERYSHG
jgi:hypothetical protein